MPKRICNKNYTSELRLILTSPVKRDLMKKLLIILVSITLVLSLAMSIPDNSESGVILNRNGHDLLDLNDSSVLAFCYTCHNPKVASHDEMLAPPLAGIKMQYKRVAGTREEFIQHMGSFVRNPTEEAAIMKGPVNRFGLMPKPAISGEEIDKIVAFIYDNDIPQPDWYAEHHRKMHGDQQP